MHTLQCARHVAIWGYGREGKAACEFVREHHPNIKITILNDTPLSDSVRKKERLDHVVSGTALTDALGSGIFDLVIRSPGISIYRKEIFQAKHRGVRFTTGTNLWFEQYPEAKKIVVTGTKGKTTSARLLHHLLQNADLDVALLGNMGEPALKYQPGRDFTVLELSSHQIADLEHGPDIALITNLFPEHQDWHETTENYFNDKLRIASLNEKTKTVGNATDQRSSELLSDRSEVVWYNQKNAFDAKAGRLHFNGGVVDVLGYPSRKGLKGDHDLENLAGVCTVANLLGMHEFRRRVDVRSFRQLPHRREEFMIGELLCVDDSISTIPQSAENAVKTYPDRDSVLLLGGGDRGQDYAALYEFLRGSKVRSVVALPPNGERIVNELSATPTPWPFKIISVTDFEGGVVEALKHAPSGGAVILSPAAPARDYGPFADYAERGNVFKEICRRNAGLVGAKAPKTPVEIATESSRRGMKSLLSGLPDDLGRQAAIDLVHEERPIAICTGFPVNGAPETDGPPGAFALLDALRVMGKTVKLASWADALQIFKKVRDDLDVIEVPVGISGGGCFIEGYALITVEACGLCEDGTYRNMNGVDISAFAPRFEEVFGFESLLSIGDGGNEFGMGSKLVPRSFYSDPDIKFGQPVSKTKNLIPAAASNYGAYAVIKELENATNRILLPDPDQHVEMIRRLVLAGCVDGFSGEFVAKVDGLELDDTLRILESLIDNG
jgi:UDP-N-acetylmuramoylalanine--D-glutamate ligase